MTQDDPDLKRAAFRATITGRVQGVGYREFARRRAALLNLTGYVRNLSDGRSVEVFAEGPQRALDQFLHRLREGPSGADVRSVDVSWESYTGLYPSFDINR